MSSTIQLIAPLSDQDKRAIIEGEAPKLQKYLRCDHRPDALSSDNLIRRLRNSKIWPFCDSPSFMTNIVKPHIPLIVDYRHSLNTPESCVNEVVNDIFRNAVGENQTTFGLKENDNDKNMSLELIDMGFINRYFNYLMQSLGSFAHYLHQTRQIYGELSSAQLERLESIDALKPKSDSSRIALLIEQLMATGILIPHSSDKNNVNPSLKFKNSSFENHFLARHFLDYDINDEWLKEITTIDLLYHSEQLILNFLHLLNKNLKLRHDDRSQRRVRELLNHLLNICKSQFPQTHSRILKHEHDCPSIPKDESQASHFCLLFLKCLNQLDNHLIGDRNIVSSIVSMYVQHTFASDSSDQAWECAHLGVWCKPSTWEILGKMLREETTQLCVLRLLAQLDWQLVSIFSVRSSISMSIDDMSCQVYEKHQPIIKTIFTRLFSYLIKSHEYERLFKDYLIEWLNRTYVDMKEIKQCLQELDEPQRNHFNQYLKRNGRRAITLSELR